MSNEEVLKAILDYDPKLATRMAERFDGLGLELVNGVPKETLDMPYGEFIKVLKEPTICTWCNSTSESTMCSLCGKKRTILRTFHSIDASFVDKCDRRFGGLNLELYDGIPKSMFKLGIGAFINKLKEVFNEEL